MQKFKVSLLCLLFIFQFTQTNSQVSITKIPGWVTKQEFGKNFELKDNESSFVYLLINDQENYSRQQQFGEYAYRVLNTEGIQSMSDLYISFDPAYEKIEIHFIKIIRGNEEINQMPVKFNILQRETNAERYLYDGSKTILVNLNDVRVGDIVHYSYSRKGYNPIFSNHFARNYNLQYGYPIVKLYNQVIIPKNLSIYWKNENTNLKPENKSNDKEISFSWTLNNLEPIIFDNNEPEWFDLTPR
ncbi:MAG: DUF3857 domain-containing protein, partial [Cyclobacteriaceae bacterium]|nr:DUF3857 domain-containing protein [Cyclobacteriaceae bacterium]